MSGTTEWTQERQDAHFMELALSLAQTAARMGQTPFGAVVVDSQGTLIGADLREAAAWVNAQPDWSKLQVVGDFMRDRALRIMATFPWAQARTRTAVEGSS